MNIFNVPFEQIGPNHILGLIGTQESEVIDFKQEAYKETDPAKLELCKDVSSFSNAQGGFIIIGIVEENDTAKEIVHVPDADLEIERIENVLLSSVYERIPILKIKKVTVPVNGENRDTIVIVAPKSLRAPHMVKRQNKTAFFKRYGRRILEMPIDEIKDAAVKSENYVTQIDKFITKRKERAIQLISGTQEKNSCLMLFATPSYLSEQNVDVERKEIQEAFNLNSAYTANHPDRQSGYIVQGNVGYTRPSVNGLIYDEGEKTELFRTGHLEAICNLDDMAVQKMKDRDDAEKKVLSAWPITEYTLSFIYLTQHVLRLSGLYYPFLLNLLLVNCEDFHLPVRHMYFRRCGENHLELPTQSVDISASPEEVAKTILDRVWQAFGIWKTPLYQNGKFNFNTRGI